MDPIHGFIFDPPAMFWWLIKVPPSCDKDKAVIENG